MAAIYTAIYDYDATDEEELTIKEGDTLIAKGEEDQDGWIECQNLASGLKGLVPFNYLELDQANTIPKASNELPVAPPPPPAPAGPSGMPPVPPPGGPGPSHQMNPNPMMETMVAPKPKDTSPLGSTYTDDGLQAGAEAGNFNRSIYASKPVQSTISRSVYSGSGIDANTKIHDPIKNIAGESGRYFGALGKHGTEEFLNGMFLGDGNSKLNDSLRFLNNKNIEIQNQEWKVMPSDSTDEWTMVVESNEAAKNSTNKHEKDNIFKVSSNPYSKFNHYINRSFKDFEWLEKQLKHKYPFIIIPELSKKPALGPIARWADYISSHPLLRSSYAVENFMMIEDHKIFKDSKKELNKDKIIGGEMLRCIDVDDFSRNPQTNSDLGVMCNDASHHYKSMQNMYKSGLTNIIENFKQAQEFERQKLHCYEEITKGMDMMSREMEKLSIYGSGQLGMALSSAAENLKNINSKVKDKRVCVLGFWVVIKLL